MSADAIQFPAELACPDCGETVTVASQRGARMELLACPNHFGADGRAGE